MEVIGIIQARMGSKRLPRKCLMDLCGKPVIYYIIERVKRANTLNTVVLATSKNSENDVLVKTAQELGIKTFRGSEDDVLGRLIEAARAYKAEIVVRICADNPLTAPEEIDRIVRHHIKKGADYSFNIVPRMGNNYPDGLGVEVINLSVLEELSSKVKFPLYREHVTTYIWEHKEEFHIETIKAPIELSGPDIKLDVDTKEDLQRLESLISVLPYEHHPLWSAKEIVRTYRNLHKKNLLNIEVEDPHQILHEGDVTFTFL